jgi:hypothetical protein
MQAMATIHHTILQSGQELLPAHIAISDCRITLSHILSRARIEHDGILYGYVPMRQAVPTMQNASIDELQIQLDILRYRFCFTLNAKRASAQVITRDGDILGAAAQNYIKGETARQCRERLLFAAYKDATATYIANSAN